MAQEKEDYSPSPSNNSDEDENPGTNENATVKPDLGFENVNFANSTSDHDVDRCEKKTSNHNRKEESSVSFKHFLRRDLSLPNTSVNSYEGTGAKPKIYSNSFHPSLGKLNIQQECSSSSDSSKQDNASYCKYKDNSVDVGSHGNEQRHFSGRSHPSSEALGMPSLPDFVQDHLLLEQAYLGTDVPLNVDLDNLPDFTINSNSNYNCTNTPDWCRNGKVYEPCDINSSAGPSLRLLDLTDSVDRHHQQQSNTNHSSFPLDLPQHASPQPTGSEGLQLPDFLPPHAGESPVEGEDGRDNRTHELDTERRLRLAAQRDLRIAQQEISNLRSEVSAARTALLRAQSSNREASTRSSNTSPEDGARSGGSDEESLIISLRSQIEQLELELRNSRLEVEELRNTRRSVARSLLHATNSAETSLRDLLSGLEQVRGLANTMDPP